METSKSTNWIVFAKKGSHSAHLISLGRRIPTCKSQLKHFNHIDIIGYDDVKVIEEKYSVKLATKPTKSGYWLRIVNQSEVISAIKKYVRSK